MMSTTSNVDWEAIFLLLADNAQKLEDRVVDPQESKRILDARARTLAVPVGREDATKQVREVVTFTVVKTSYALETRYVREIRRLADVSALPGAPAWFFGLTNLRGTLLPLVDLRKLLDATTTGLANFPLLIVLGEAQPEFAFLIDAVLDVALMDASAFFDTRHAGGDEGAAAGVSEDGLVLLDGKRLLEDRRLFVEAD